MMKKMLYCTLMLMLSFILIGSGSAEEKVKPDNQNAVIVSSFEQASTSVAKISKSTDGSLSVNFDIEIDEYDPGLCNHLKKLCQDVSPANQDPICVFWTEENCPIHFP